MIRLAVILNGIKKPVYVPPMNQEGLNQST